MFGHAQTMTPVLMDYTKLRDDNSLTNTINTFAVYVVDLMLEWLEKQGGVSAIQSINEDKAQKLYQFLDASDFYEPFAHPEYRSMMNVTFNLRDKNLEGEFVKKAQAQGLYALKGHRAVGGIRASIYNSMPMEGVTALIKFMKEFETSQT